MTYEQQSQTTDSPTVSIIVPVYNAQNCIARCIDSILKQTYENFELLLIDDGSQDASGEICDDYAAKDTRIRVIHKPNTGVSDSRNIAIEAARGTYLQFVDSDDWIAPEATGSLLFAAQSHDCDLVVSDFYRVIDNRIAHKGDIQEDGLLSREEFAAHMMENPADFYYGVLWNKLYRRELIRQFQIQMDTEISWCEDFMFNLEYICHVESIYVLREPIYYYVKTKHSLSTQGISLTKTVKMKTTVFEYYKNFYKEVFDEKDYEKSRLQVYRFLVDAANDGIVPPSLLPGVFRLGEERTQINPNVLEHETLLLDVYLERKCLELCLQPLIYRYDLQIDELCLLLFLMGNHDMHTRKELADFLGQSKRTLSAVLQKLKTRGYILWTDHTAPSKHIQLTVQPAKSTTKLENSTAELGNSTAKLLDIQLQPAAEPILAELEKAQEHYQQIRFAGLTESEIAAYKEISGKIRQNIIRHG